VRSRTLQIALPAELTRYVQRMVQGGRYQDESDVVREALRRMEAAEISEEIKQFDRAFSGGHDREETEDEIRQIESAVRAGRKG